MLSKKRVYMPLKISLKR